MVFRIAWIQPILSICSPKQPKVIVSTRPNNMQVDAVTITQVYKNRWHVELFFKWIKQHLCIKRFFGRTDNAVQSQIWIAMCVYLLILMLKKRMELDQSAYEIFTNIKCVSIHQNATFAVVFE